MRRDRIDRWISEISRFSDMEEGIYRRSYTPAYESALKYLTTQMEDLQMSVRIDGAGNLIGRYDPMASCEKPIAIGSHLDTVRDGGAFDGVLGIAAALEIIHRAVEEGRHFTRPIEVIAFAEEEGGLYSKGCIGSEYITGNTPLALMEELGDEHNKLSLLTEGMDIDKVRFPADYAWGRDYYHSFYEIHCEQGERLIEESKSIGIVTGVVGIARNLITFHGEPNHAGTTTMNRRRDASIPMAQFILAANRAGRLNQEHIVATTGRIDLYPNQHNVVPGRAAVTLELRGDRDDRISEVLEELRLEALRIGEEHGVEVSLGDPAFTPVRHFDSSIVQGLTAAAEGNPEATETFSWAGHDAKIMSYAAPAGMLFVPSLRGLSHCPEEYTSSEDILRAVEILEDTLYNI